MVRLGAWGAIRMAASELFDQRSLLQAYAEVETVQRKLPEDALGVIAREVVRRLADQISERLAEVGQPSDPVIDELCNALLSDDREAAARMITKAQRDGASHEALCLSYLAVAARRLGDWWEEDRVSFVKVTMAAGRVYAILRGLRRETPLRILNPKKVATFVSVPGDNHELGVTMAADLLRERGWDIRLLVGMDHDDLIDELAADPPSLIGISTGGKRSLPALLRLIVALRIATRPARILVCGQIANDDFHLVGVSGADSVARDFETAATEMNRLIGLSPAT